MKQTKQQQASKVVPFIGEFYPQAPTAAETADKFPAYLFMLAAALIAGLSMGAIATYQSADQAQLRELKAQSQQFEAVKNQVCKP